MAMQPAKMGGASGYISGCFAATSQLSSKKQLRSAAHSTARNAVLIPYLREPRVGGASIPLGRRCSLKHVCSMVHLARHMRRLQWAQIVLSPHKKVARQSLQTWPPWWFMYDTMYLLSECTSTWCRHMSGSTKLHKPMDVQFHCVIKKRLQLKRKMSLSVFDAVRVKYRKATIVLLYPYGVWSIDLCRKSHLKQFSVRQQHNKTWFFLLLQGTVYKHK